jgi:hypothetical protein
MTSRTNYYKTVSQVYRHIDVDNNMMKFTHPYDEKSEHIQKMIEDIAQRNNEIETQSNEDLLHFDNSEIRMNTNISAQINVPIENTIAEPEPENFVNCHEKASNDPQKWGPPFWYILHNGAFHYPENASKFYIERMKNFILGIPVMLPCEKCKNHATIFIEQHKSQLNDICSGRKSLFNFFVDFHNKVNARYDKPVLSYEEAYNIYR